MDSKKIIDISYDRIMDRIFKLKEREKDTFTDRLHIMTDEERAVDNILKINNSPNYCLLLYTAVNY